MKIAPAMRAKVLFLRRQICKYVTFLPPWFLKLTKNDYVAYLLIPPLKEFAVAFCRVNSLRNFDTNIRVTLSTTLALSFQHSRFKQGSKGSLTLFQASICQLLVEMSVFVV